MGSHSQWPEMPDQRPGELQPPLPDNAPVENPPWNGSDVTVLAFMMFVVPMLLAPFVVLAAQKMLYPHSSFGDVALLHPTIALGLQFVWFSVVAVCLLGYVPRHYKQPFWSAIHWNWPKGRWAVLLLVAVGILIISKLLELLLPFPKEGPFEQFFTSPADAVAFAVLAVAFAPFMEELFFRGFLYPVLARRWGINAGILLTAVPFALIHYPEYKSWGPVLIIFIVGIVLTWVRAYMRSVGASFLVHAIYNGVPMLAAIVISHGFQRLDKLSP